MALKPTNAEVQRRKKDLKDFMEQHSYSAQDVCDLLNDADNLKPVSLRTVFSWLAAPETTSSRTPPPTLMDTLRRRQADRTKLAS